MGIVSSTFASLAIQFAWNCQRLLDPWYRCVDNKPANETPSITGTPILKSATKHEETIITNVPAVVIKANESRLLPHHKEVRERRTEQLANSRPSTFDTSLNVRTNSKIKSFTLPLTRATYRTSNPILQRPHFWDATSSSGCSSDSGSDLGLCLREHSWNVFSSSSSGCSSDSGSDYDSSSEEELKALNEPETTDKDSTNRKTLSAAEETAFRLTIGRGHFTRSKKDRFLNHLRLEKRLSDMNDEIFETGGVSYCRRQRSHTLDRYHSNSLRKEV